MPYITGSADRRLLLLYLANDVLQNGKRKGADDFTELFRDPLKESMRLIRYVLYISSYFIRDDITKYQIYLLGILMCYYKHCKQVI